jgi:nitrite reductase (NADH) small subunit
VEIVRSKGVEEMIRVARVDELTNGRGKCVQAFGRSVALFRSGDRIYAIDDMCPHRGGPLSEGDLEESMGIVICPLHAWTFELATGAMMGNPAFKIPTYRVEVRGDEIWLAPTSQQPA